jgi:hypothetical protein
VYCNCGLAIYILKSIILRQKKNYEGNSNISPCKKIIPNLPKKSSKKETQNPSRYYISITTNLSSLNTSQNIIFHKSQNVKFIISSSGKTWDCNPLPFVLYILFSFAFPQEGKFSLDDITWNGRGVS